MKPTQSTKPKITLPQIFSLSDPIWWVSRHKAYSNGANARSASFFDSDMRCA
jgi:hypothetical protein